ncbi:hypothetical protein Sjap_021739 [Stephania japonica]|uniref:Fe2OG dioxygenase domain-containing protein n=1 Tax=Stephania japonica TaxID=461633 RepID=A0AAP0ESU1_9MAGN
MEIESIINSVPLALESVQVLASKNLGTIPSRYIRHDLVQKVDHEILVKEIPVINLSKLIDSDAGFSQEEMDKLHLACQEWGFFQLVNHGVAEEVMKKMIEDVSSFFNLPFEHKKQCSQDAEGYGQALVFSEEQKLDWGDMLFLRTQPVALRNYQVWPAQHLIPTFRETVSMYSLEMEKVRTILLGLMAKSLGVDEGNFINMFRDGSQQSMRMNYYPPCPEASKVLGISPHSDATGLTILLQLNQVDGLQIRHDGTWLPVKLLPGALLVNIGDIIEVIPILSNGIYKSIEHRVIVSKEKERISVAAFHETHESVEIGPLPELIINGETAKYRSVKNYDEFEKIFLSRKLDGKSLLEFLRLNN